MERTSPTLPCPPSEDALPGLPPVSLSRIDVRATLLVVVCLLVLMVHLPALNSEAAFHDDDQYVVRNALVQNPSWLSLRTFFGEVFKPSTVGGYYQPLTMVSLMFDCFLAGPPYHPVLFHRTSLLLHVANTALVLLVLHLLFQNPWASATAALFFGLHPMSVDSVCWLSERKTVLATFFALSSLAFYLLSVKRARRVYSVSALALYTLALLSKPTTVPLPAMMILMDYWPLRRLSRRTVLSKIPFLLMGALFAAITFISQGRSAGVVLPHAKDVWFIPLLLSHNIIFYPSKILCPMRMSPYYYQEFATFNLSNGLVLTNLVAALVLLIVVMISLRWTRVLFTGSALFFVGIFPTMGLVRFTDVLAANRFAYLPSLGFLMMLTAFLARFRPGPGVHPGTCRRAYVLIALVLGVALAEATVTRRYIRHWRDTESLYRYTITLSPEAASLYGDFGTLLLSRGDVAKAKEYYVRALQLHPGLASARNNLAMLLYEEEGNVKEAVAQLTLMVRLWPDFVFARYNLGHIYLMEGDFGQAEAHLRQAVCTYPYYSEGRHNLVRALLAQGEDRDAIAELRGILQLNAPFVPALTHLAWLLATHPEAEIRRPDEARRLAERADAMTRGRDVSALDALAAAYATEGQYRRAAETAQRALTIVARTGDSDATARLQERLRLYQRGCPYFENPRVVLDHFMAQARKNRQARDRAPGSGNAAATGGGGRHDGPPSEPQTSK